MIPSKAHKNPLPTRLLSAIALAGAMLAAERAGAATLVSSALDNSQTDMTGDNGIFSGTAGGDTAPAIADVTTTVVSSIGALGGKFASGTEGAQTQTLRAVSATNEMDLTYTVTYTPFYFDGSSDKDGSTRRGGYVAVSSDNTNGNREQTTGATGNVEFWRVTVGNTINSGATSFSLDGVVTLRFNGLSGIDVLDTYVNGVTGTLLGSGGTGTSVSGDSDISLSSASTSFAIVATADDTTGPRANFENRWEGLAVQFTAIPEPSTSLLGSFGLLMLLRRRR